MRNDHDGGPIAREVTATYVGVMSALEGASTGSIQSALAAAIVITGERAGLEGPELAAWIDTISHRAHAAILKSPARVQSVQ